MPFVATAGNNASGQLGRQGPSHSFLIVTLEEDVIHVCCGYFHTIALTCLGNVYVWGRNTEGQLGLSPAKGGIVRNPERLPISQKIVKCAAGEVHTMLLSAEGDVFVCGGGACGQLGNGTCPTVSEQLSRVQISEPVVDIASGARSCFALTRSGAVWGWGESVYGNLGVLAPTPVSLFPTKLRIGPSEMRVARLAPGSTFTAFISTQGDAVVCGKLPTGVATICASDHHGWRLLRMSHRILDMGCTNNTMVTLLHSDTVEVRIDGDAYEVTLPRPCSALAASRHGALFVTTSHELYVTGRCGRGEFGLADTKVVGRSITKVPLPVDLGVLTVSTGWNHSAVLLADRRNLSQSSNLGSDRDEDSALRPPTMRASQTQWGEEIANVSFSRKSSWSKKSFVVAAPTAPIVHDAFRNTKLIAVSIGLSLLMGYIGAAAAKKR